MTETPTLFDPSNPQLQLIWDASTLVDLTNCPHKYELGHVHGWSPNTDKNDLSFGSAVGHGLEFLINGIVGGASLDDAVRAAVRAVLAETWDDAAGQPKMGMFVDVWRCLGTAKFKNDKGNAAKCPWSHKGKFFLAPAPQTCRCGSPTETSNRWFPDDPVKDRLQAVRAVVWYAEEIKGGRLRPMAITMEDGSLKPLTELNWVVPFKVIGGKQFHLAGNWDTVKQLANDADATPTEVFPADYKTTRYSLGDDYFATFRPGWQVDMYDLVATVVLPEGLREKYGGILIEAIQTGTGWVRFGSRTFASTDGQKMELVNDLTVWLSLAKEYAEVGFWPWNRGHCRLCHFKGVCTARPEDRDGILSREFTRSFWSPLTRRREPAATGRGRAPLRDEAAPATCIDTTPKTCED